MLGGVHIPAVTPFDAVTGEVDRLALRENVRRWMGSPVRGIVVSGTTGEAVLLDRDERGAVVEAARGVIPEDRILIAGTGAESTRSTLRLTRDAAEAGADAVLVQPPSFYRAAMDRAALGAHFRKIADASPVPVILYQVPPSCSTIGLSTGLVAELARHPNIIGIKDSRGDLDELGALLTHASDGFEVLSGDATRFYAALELGVAGGILALANLFPTEVAALERAFRDGRSAEAGRLQERMGPVARTIVGRHGVPGVKAAMDLIGSRGGAPRPPLRALGEKAREAVRDALGALDQPT